LDYTSLSAAILEQQPQTALERIIFGSNKE